MASVSEPRRAQDPTDAGPAPDFFCVECGYDLRGIGSDACPECGEAIDRAVPAASRIPWVHRRRIGVLRAYRRTVGLAIFHPSRLAQDAFLPGDLPAARRFLVLTALLAALPPIALWAALAATASGQKALEFLAIPTSLNWVGGQPIRWDWRYELWVPWAAGMSAWPVPPAAISAAFLFVGDAARSAFHPKRLSAARQRAAVAVGCYACAPLALTFIPTLALAGLVAMDLTGYATSSPGGPPLILAKFVASAGALLIIVSFWRATVALLRGATEARWGRVVAAAMLAPLAWTLCIAAGLGVIPWTIGFLSLVAASLS